MPEILVPSKKHLETGGSQNIWRKIHIHDKFSTRGLFPDTSRLGQSRGFREILPHCTVLYVAPQSSARAVINDRGNHIDYTRLLESLTQAPQREGKEKRIKFERVNPGRIGEF